MAQISFFPLGNFQNIYRLDEQSACEIIYRTRARLPPGCSQVAHKLSPSWKYLCPSSSPMAKILIPKLSSVKNIYGAPMTQNIYAQVAPRFKILMAHPWPKIFMPKILMALPWPKIFMAFPWPKIFMAFPWPKILMALSWPKIL